MFSYPNMEIAQIDGWPIQTLDLSDYQEKNKVI